VLKPGGVLLFSTLGPDTLVELRRSWATADSYNHVNGFLDPAAPTPAQWVVVAAEPVTDVDITAAEALAALDDDLEKAGIQLCFAEMKDPVKDRLKRYDLYGKIGSEHFFPTLGRAVDAYQEEHREVDWAAWVDRGEGGLVPGALDFLRAARDQGYRIFYGTNRTCPDGGRGEAYPHPACPQREATVALARRLDLPFADDPKSFLLRNDQTGWESGDKSPRRRFLSRSWKVVMLVGDDLGDFLPRDRVQALRAQRPAGQTVGESAPLPIAAWRERFGTQWFLLPNPAYGSWETSLAPCAVPDRESADCTRQRLEGKYRVLVPATPPPPAP